MRQERPASPERVEFGNRTNQRQFFLNARKPYETWGIFYRELAALGNNIQFTFRQLKRWTLGQSLPTREAVDLVCKVSGQELSQLNVTVKAANWGTVIGGQRKIAIHGCNLTLANRIKGGRIVGRSNSIDHLRTVASLGAIESLRSGKNPRRTVSGPGGIRMFNELEREVLMRMIGAGRSVIYEPVVKVGSRRPVPDFQVGSIFIECTCDPKVNAKALRLLEKFELLRTHAGLRKAIVITLPSLVGRYKHYLGESSHVTTVRDLLSIV